MPDPVNSKNPAPIKEMMAAAAEAKLDAMLGIGTFLTAEEMFLFAEAQLKDTDAKIQEHVNAINATKKLASSLQEISAGLRQIQNCSKADQQKKFEELIQKAEAAGAYDIKNKLVAWKQVVDGNQGGPGGGATTSQTVEGWAQEVDAAATELTSSTELTMIKVQGLMQFRSQILQLASNVIAALNEPAKNAIGNIRG